MPCISYKALLYSRKIALAWFQPHAAKTDTSGDIFGFIQRENGSILVILTSFGVKFRDIIFKILSQQVIAKVHATKVHTCIYTWD